ncbi:MAG TPA: hypothetical protein VNJ04_12170 [Gemmatimonadaceae bacterium]|nr:hypothetical protein [Gemmatimonadaceae bacterium]
MKRDELLQGAAASIQQAAGNLYVADQPRYLTAVEAADYLRYASVRALYKAIPTCGIPVCRRGPKTYLFDRLELDRWLTVQRRPVKRVARVHAESLAATGRAR